MFYAWAIAVPKNTAESAPVEQVMKLTQGVVTRVEVQFPDGCDGLAHCRILQGGHQLWPTLPSTSLVSSGYTIVIDENHELTGEPFEFKAQCWNLDDTFPHTLYVRVGILRGQAAVWILKIFQGLEKFLKLVGIKV